MFSPSCVLRPAGATAPPQRATRANGHALSLAPCRGSTAATISACASSSPNTLCTLRPASLRTIPTSAQRHRSGAGASTARRSARGSAVVCLAMTSKPDVDFAVVGGGPAGLAMAKALMNAMPGRSVQVYESAAGYRPQGAGVLIEVNGWRALHAIDDDLATKMRAGGILMHGGTFFDEQGNKLPFNLPDDHEQRVKAHGHTQVMVHWGDIREILFSSLPPGTVHFSTRVVGIKPGAPGAEPAQVQLQEAAAAAAGDKGAADGQGAAPAAASSRSVSAGLVIAADGYFSRTKRQVFGGGMPVLRGKVVWRALVDYKDEQEVPQVLKDHPTDSLWYMQPGLATPPRIALVYPVGKNRFVWTCTARLEDIEAAGHTWSKAKGDDDLGIQQTGVVGAGAKERCLAVFKNHPSEVVDLLQRTDPRVITEHGYYTHDIAALQGEPDWVRGNVVVVGDAAHTGPPDGMGLNMAWEDVATLAACLRDHGVSQEALSAYVRERLPRVQGVWSESETIVKPKRTQAVNAAAFKPLGKDSGRSAPPRAPAGAAA